MKPIDREISPPLQLKELDASILRSLLYADLFKYPLKPGEIARRCDQPGVDVEEVESHLRVLEEKKLVRKEGYFYYLGEENGKVNRRLAGNALASKRMEKALRVSRFIGKFPYVRAVMLSGSLSKDYMEPDSDIDYFIVTEPGRLWVARTFLVLYKKTFLLNSHKHFCVNYFVDSHHLEIEDKNLFTATEVVTLAPATNYPLYSKFRSENGWADRTYPNYGLRAEEACKPHPQAWWGRAWEKLLSGKLGERLDTWCLKRTLLRWQKKFPDFTQEKFDLALRSKKYVSKHHPSHFQEKVMRRFQERIRSFESQHGVKL